MRSGRPAYHIKAKWITFMNPNSKMEYFELQTSGKIVKKENEIKVHHMFDTLPLVSIEQKESSTEPAVSEIVEYFDDFTSWDYLITDL